MTVKELIEILLKMPQDAKVFRTPTDVNDEPEPELYPDGVYL
jgi:hypothetical protein